MSDGRARRSLAADGEILRSLAWRDWVAVALVTLACGLTAFLLFPPLLAAAAMVLGALAVVVAACDARVLLIPDVLSLALFVSGLAATTGLAAFAPDQWASDTAWPAAATLALAGALLGAALLGGLRWLWLRLRSVEAIGFGDVKLAGALGAWLGPVDVCTALLVAALAGLAVAGLSRRRGAFATDLPHRLPFAAFLAPASWLVFVLTRL